VHDEETTDLVVSDGGRDVGPQEGQTSILWHSNAPWVGSGYGTQSALFGPAVARLGYRLAFSAFYGLKGSRLGWQAPDGEGYYVYPASDSPGHGNDVITAHAHHWFNGGPGLVILLTDPWVLNPRICAGLPMLAWTPVDHEPLMPRTHEWLASSKAIPLAMSHFGERMMKDNGFSPFYAPHGFDSNVFKPLDRAEARRLLKIPESAFLVGMVAANLGSRKCYPQALQAFKAFKQRVGRDAQLYLHTQLEREGGENLPAICDMLGLAPHTSDPYRMVIGAPAMSVAALMNAFDVLLNPAQGEGFGVPQVEAQACGTPVICTDFSASPEVAPASVGNWNVPGQPEWTGFESYQLRPNVEALTEALVKAYEEPEKDRLQRRASVADWALQEYEVEHVTQTYWKPVLEDTFDRISFNNRRMARA
jgi:glycosyltransferase involved in cell wall biosynthesis